MRCLDRKGDSLARPRNLGILLSKLRKLGWGLFKETPQDHGGSCSLGQFLPVDVDAVMAQGQGGAQMKENMPYKGFGQRGFRSLRVQTIVVTDYVAKVDCSI
jgi:hypothetical protein